MGNELLTFYHNKIKKTWKTAFYSAFFLGLLVHMYRFTNVLPNADALYNFFSSQNMVTSGRWFLSAACGLSSWFDLPWAIGILSMFFMGLTAAVVAEVFRMENPCLIVLCSGLQVSFPAITATMGYEFTADGYMFSMLLAALSVCITRMEHIGKGYWIRMVLSAVCICLSCAIYQAYVSFAFILAVCYFMTELLENRRDTRTLLRWIGAQVVIYVAALASYYIIWKLLLNILGIAASGYHGIDQVGALSGGQLLYSVRNILRDFALFFVELNPLVYGFSVYSALNLLYVIATIVVLGIALVKSGCIRRTLHMGLLVLCLGAIPFGCYIWYLTSPTVFYHALMLQSIAVLFIFTAVLFERWAQPKLSNLALALLVVIVLNNSVNANKYYTLMNQCYEKTYATAVEISTRVHLLDDGTIRYVAFCGELDEWPSEGDVEPDLRRHLGGWKGVHRTVLHPLFFHLYTDFDLSYYRINQVDHPVVERHSSNPSPYNWYYRFPLLSAEEEQTLLASQQVQQMPIWPAADSVQVVGDTVVVKLSD